MPERIEPDDLPAEIIVSYEKLNRETNKRENDLNENITGTLLIKRMSDIYLSEPEIEVITRKNEKPRAYIHGNEISVSFSHTNDALSLGMSKRYVVGCDMEAADRKVSTSLLHRMKNTCESETLYQKAEPIQIWTLKESALKMIGTGLRKPMNSVQISMRDPFNFDVDYHDGRKAKICSFLHKNHWISICYQEQKVIGVALL